MWWNCVDRLLCSIYSHIVIHKRNCLFVALVTSCLRPIKGAKHMHKWLRKNKQVWKSEKNVKRGEGCGRGAQNMMEAQQVSVDATVCMVKCFFKSFTSTLFVLCIVYVWASFNLTCQGCLQQDLWCILNFTFSVGWNSTQIKLFQ